MGKVALTSPWAQYYEKIKLLFGKDPEIRCEFDNDSHTIWLYVDNGEKAEAIANLLPPEKHFGNVTVSVFVVPSNRLKETAMDTFRKAFSGNPVFCYAEISDSLPLSESLFVVFAKEVAQYFNDDIGDVHGVCSTLYQEIAKEVLIAPLPVHYCTETRAYDDTAQ